MYPGDSIYDKMSRAETMVCNFLKELKIWWCFESPVFVTDDADRPRVWSPDLYLPDLGIYVEVACDWKNRNYEYREKIYRKNHIPVLFVEPYDNKSWKKNLVEQIYEIHQDRWEILKRIK
jgi:hypothetical protein